MRVCIYVSASASMCVTARQGERSDKTPTELYVDFRWSASWEDFVAHLEIWVALLTLCECENGCRLKTSTMTDRDQHVDGDIEKRWIASNLIYLGC